MSKFWYKCTMTLQNLERSMEHVIFILTAKCENKFLAPCSKNSVYHPFQPKRRGDYPKSVTKRIWKYIRFSGRVRKGLPQIIEKIICPPCAPHRPMSRYFFHFSPPQRVLFFCPSQTRFWEEKKRKEVREKRDGRHWWLQWDERHWWW